MINPYEVTQEAPDEEIAPDQDELSFQLMNHAMNMVYASLAADGATRDADWERERDHYAEELALENRRPRKDAA